MTRYRHGVFDEQTPAPCEEMTRKTRDDFNTRLAEFNGEEDHAHLLVRRPPKAAVPTLVNSLKGTSARRLRREHTGRVNRARTNGHFWSPSSFAASCGGTPLPIIKQDIEQQQRPA